MMILTIDVETRSTVDLRKAGAHRYAEDPTTDIICLAAKLDDGEPVLWFPTKFLDTVIAWRDSEADLVPCDQTNSPEPPELPFRTITDKGLQDLIRNADLIEAHNAEFELAMWSAVMVKRYGFEGLPLDRIRCSAAKAAMHSLPRSLEGAGSALGLKTQKDMDGRRLMLKMCKPRAPRKAEVEGFRFAGLDPKAQVLWHEDPEQVVRLAEYCARDVEAEAELSGRLRDLPPAEQEIFKLHVVINSRGVQADLDSVGKIVEAMEAHEDRLLKELGKHCPYSPTQVEAMKLWLKDDFGIEVESLDKNAVLELLDREDLPEPVRDALRIRQSLGKASTAKYQAIQRAACADGRVRGLHLYHGAGTGRWSGRLVQTQNLPRGSFPDTEPAIELMRAGDLEGVEMLYGDPMDVASTLIRPMLVAAPGKDLICGDFAGIEARAVAHLAGERRALEIFRSRQDIYKYAASDVFGIPPDKIDKSRRQIGKVVILACGYQGHVGAFQSMAEVYGVKVPDERAAEIVNAWRDKNQSIVKYWYALEDAAKLAVSRPGQLTQVGNVKFQTRGGFLVCRLPSGRCLFYPHPHLREKETPNGTLKLQVHYWGEDTFTKKWTTLSTYGGKLCENIVQAFCADLLREAMRRVEAAGYPVVMHVHDEIVSEVQENRGTVEQFAELMKEVPPWAAGMPIDVEAWRGKRYKK